MMTAHRFSTHPLWIWPKRVLCCIVLVPVFTMFAGLAFGSQHGKALATKPIDPFVGKYKSVPTPKGDLSKAPPMLLVLYADHTFKLNSTVEFDGIWKPVGDKLEMTALKRANQAVENQDSNHAFYRVSKDRKTLIPPGLPMTWQRK